MNMRFLLGVGLGFTGLGGYYLVRGWRWSPEEWRANRSPRRAALFVGDCGVSRRRDRGAPAGVVHDQRS